MDWKMDNQKENIFLDKFRSLNSQEHTEEINWSSSSTSDYEHTSNYRFSYQVTKMQTKKRKRKKKALKNISNLSITILDASNANKKVKVLEKSPILGCKSRQKNTSGSPILKPVQSFKKGNTITSPILTSKTMRLRSPILVPKTGSPKSAVKVRKKLFNVNTDNLNKNTKQEVSEFPAEIEEDADECNIITHQSEEFDKNNSLNKKMTRAKLDLAERVKSFFNSHFSSENTSGASQNSISDIISPKNSTKTSDEIEILTCKTQVLSNNNSIQSLKPDSSVNSSESSLYNFNKNSKKIRYKKNGLAFRLNNILKKQNASVSLWQHEQFLAVNSNFVIPKGEFTVFQIQTVNFKYGCHLLQAVDLKNEHFLILINSLYISHSIVSETFLKLYEPFKIVQYDDKCKLIINVIKFECSN